MANEQVLSNSEMLDGEEIRQVPYLPKSEAPKVDTLVPANMRLPIANALNRLEQNVGNLDNYVAKRLGLADRETLYSRYSAEQIDALALAIHNLEKGDAFIIGDQTGIGKGRFVAGIIEYAKQKELIPVFITEKPELYTDIFRDLDDIKAQKLNPLITNASEKIALADGTILTTGSLNAQKRLIQSIIEQQDLGNYNAVFTTYAQLQTVKGKDTERRELLRVIAPKSILVLDESHNAGGTAKTAEKAEAPDRAAYVRELVKLASGVVYSSATYAKNPYVMTLYSARTGMRHAVEKEENLVEMIQTGGIPVQQILAAKLTEAGQYIRRERSYTGIEFGAKVLPVNRDIAENISKTMSLVVEFDEAKQEAVQRLEKEFKVTAQREGQGGSEEADLTSSNFTGLMHNVVNQTLLAMKSEATVQEALEALKRGEKPVIGLSNTMGAFIAKAAKQQSIQPGEPIQLGIGDLLMYSLEQSRAITLKDSEGNESTYRITDAELGSEAVRVYKAAQQIIQGTDWSGIPISPIDYMRYRLSEEGYRVNELTKRDERIEYGVDGVQYYTLRNLAEKSPEANNKRVADFNSGELDVLILNRSGATGISLHSSKTFSDQRPRRLLIAQPELNVDQFIQMLGRVHRTGQVVKPSFTVLMGDLPAEKRIAAVLLKKLASLNANTTAAREGGFNLNQVTDFMNQYGDQVVLDLMVNNPDLHRRLGSPIKGLNDETDVAAIDTTDMVSKVTGRIPLLPLSEQDQVYNQIERDYKELLERERTKGNSILEAEALDLDARTVARVEVLPSQGGQKNIIDEPVYLEVVDVKARRKPITTLEAINLVRSAVGLKPVQSIEKHDPDQVEILAQAQTNDRLDAIAERIPIYREVFRSRAEADVLNEKKMAQRSDKQRQERVERRVYHYDTRAVNFLADLRKDFQKLLPGQSVRVTHRLDHSVHYGVIEGYTNSGGEKGHPVLPSNWKMQVVVADSFRRMSIPMSQVNQNWETGYFVNAEVSTWLGKNIYELFDERQSRSREVRQMFTGNVLRGYEKFEGKLVNYTDKDGNIKQGMLMGPDFDLTKRLELEPVVMPSAQQALSYLKQHKSDLQTTDGELQIRPVERAQGEVYILRTSAGPVGASYHSDKQLLKTIGSEFVSVSGWADAVVTKERIGAALNYLVEQKAIGVAAYHQTEKAREFLGIELPNVRPYLEAASAEVYQASTSQRAITQPDEGRETLEQNIVELLREGGLTEKIAETTGFSIRVENEPHIPLVIEHNNDQLSLTQYQIKDGEMFANTELVFKVEPDGKLELRETANQDSAGGEVRGQSTEFALSVSKNLLRQGYSEAIIKTVQSSAQEPELEVLQWHQLKRKDGLALEKKESQKIAPKSSDVPPAQLRESSAMEKRQSNRKRGPSR